MTGVVGVYCLSLHAHYACRRSGACCTSGWPIPVSADECARLKAGLARATLSLPAAHHGENPFEESPGLPPDAAAILAPGSDAGCVFYDRAGRRCVVHRDLGHDALPSSCQHFPRVCLSDPSGTFVSLSHYCPTVAALAFDESSPLAIVEAPPAFSRGIRLEGLDARSVLPPLLHPEMLADHDGYRAWERVAVDSMEFDASPEDALRHLATITEAVRTWRPGAASLAGSVERAAREARVARRAGTTVDFGESERLAARLRGAVPVGLEPVPAARADLGGVYGSLVAPAWASFARPVRHYLAARLFANWAAYQGRGLRTVLYSAVAALATVRVEATRLCAAAERRLDAALLQEAFRAADLRLVHLARPEKLATELSCVETGPPEAMLAVL